MNRLALVLVLVLAGILQAGCGDANRAPAGLQGDAARGRVALAQYGCRACHMIPGVTGSKVWVGRPLEEMARRPLIAGSLPNTQANLVRWIRDPQAIDPRTAMPVLGVSERDAIDMSAYLLSH
jgi:cytochrome c1